MDTKPQSNHQVRILTLEDGHFQDETLYRLKKGEFILFDFDYYFVIIFLIYIIFYRVVLRVSIGSISLWI